MRLANALMRCVNDSFVHGTTLSGSAPRGSAQPKEVFMSLKKICAVLVLGALALSQPAFAGDSEWLTSFEKAKAASKKSGKPILVDFTGSDWCGWCIKLNKEVFSTKEFKDWAKQNVILLELDFPRKKAQADELKKQNRALAQQYGVRGYPTILFLDHEGKKLGKSGYMKGGPKAWLAKANTIIAKAKAKNAKG